MMGLVFGLSTSAAQMDCRQYKKPSGDKIFVTFLYLAWKKLVPKHSNQFHFEGLGVSRNPFDSKCFRVVQKPVKLLSRV